jgi:hypothetical protein
MAMGQMPPSIARNVLIYPPPEQARELDRLWAYATGG